MVRIHSSQNRGYLRYVIFIIFIVFIIIIFRQYNNISKKPLFNGPPTQESNLRGENSKIISATTWNIAAINNNPFEYWITNPDPNYNELMKKVSNVIQFSSKFDNTKIEDIFTSKMFDDLAAQIKINLPSDSLQSDLNELKEYYETQYKNRTILNQFLKDGLIGKKRLVSMPDRVTNTITAITENGGTSSVMRPTVINCYTSHPLSSTESWWTLWLEFMFDTTISVQNHGKNKDQTKIESKNVKVYQLLQKIDRSKYPAVTPQEEKLSLYLQLVNLAIFDNVLVYLLNNIAPNVWENIRKDICLSLNANKLKNTVSILSNQYGQSDVIFLQEVSAQFPMKLKLIEETTPLSIRLSETYHIIASNQYLDVERDQNSFILLKKNKFTEIQEVTDQVYDILKNNSNKEGKKLPVVNGDLVVLTALNIADKTRYVLASFHGDTNGLATIPVVEAVHGYTVKFQPASKLLFGLDANSHAHADSDKLGVTDFAHFYTNKKLNSCYGKTPNPLNFTTFHARTHLQPQLNKAVSLEDKDKKGDKNPKDFILFFDSDFHVLLTTKDNTGRKEYIENMVFPTLQFPSDHGITSTVLMENEIH